MDTTVVHSIEVILGYLKSEAVKPVYSIRHRLLLGHQFDFFL